jgi:hypothetical protein
VSHRLDHGHLDDSERELLRALRRNAARKSWLLGGVLVVAAAFLVWLTWWAVDGLLGDDGAPATTTPTQRVIADGEKALTDWGEFAVSNDLSDVKDSFWANGPQYKLLATQAKERKGKPIGPPPYKMTMSGVKVLTPKENQRVLRGKVQMTRPGEVPQTFNWDLLLQADPAAGGRWRLWTVSKTAGP